MQPKQSLTKHIDSIAWQHWVNLRLLGKQVVDYRYRGSDIKKLEVSERLQMPQLLHDTCLCCSWNILVIPGMYYSFLECMNNSWNAWIIPQSDTSSLTTSSQPNHSHSVGGCKLIYTPFSLPESLAYQRVQQCDNHGHYQMTGKNHS